MSNIKIGNNVIQNVTTVKLESADTAGQYVTFSEGDGGIQGYTLTKTTSAGWIEYIKSDGTTGTLSAANTPVSDVVFCYAYGPMGAYINNGHVISMNEGEGINDKSAGGDFGLPAAFMLLANTSVILQNGG